jgi:acetyltransferase
MTGWAKALFDPSRLAVVGATSKKGKAGYITMSNLLGADPAFAGEVIPIHPKEAEIQGKKAYPRLVDIGRQVDLAIIVTPPATLPGIMQDCAEAQIGTALVISSGFAETGEEGKALEDRMMAVAREGGIRVIGPNCFGVLNARNGLNASIALGLPPAGGISLITQSGAYGMAAFTHSRESDLGFAKVASPGNKADINEVDLLRALGEDDETRVIAMLIESFNDGRGFFDAARAITPKKPVVVLKTGRGDAAKRAAASHTAALAGDSAIASAALEQAGVIVVRDGLALLDAAAALDRQGPLRGDRVGIVTNSGGTGVELADLLEEGGLRVPKFSKGLQSEIAALLPAFGSALNPVDMTTDWARYPEIYGEATRALFASDEVDAIMLVLLQRSALMPEVTDRVIAEFERARAANNDKPLQVCWVASSEADGNRKRLLSAGIPCEPWTDRAARCLINTCARDVHPAPKSVPGPLAAPDVSQDADWLPAAAVFEALQAHKLPVTPWRLAETSAQALEAANSLGFPLVMKAERAELVHKSEAGGVALGLSDEAAVERTFADFERRLGPGPALLQAQAAAGLELIVGGYRDVQFGPVVLFGLGGIWVEALHDVALRLAPIGEAEALDMIASLKSQALLDGHRGGPGVDRDALAKLIAQVSAWFAAAPWAEELDINPLIANGTDLTVVDARIRLHTTKP